MLVRLCTHHKRLAGLREESVTALMDQQFAVDTLVALPAQPPYPFATVATVGFLQDKTPDRRLDYNPHEHRSEFFQLTDRIHQ